MASVMYPNAIDQMMQGNVDLANDTIKAVLVDLADYTYSAAHTDLTDVPAGARISTFTLAGKTVSSGVFDATDGTFASATGDPAEAVILYLDTGVEATSLLYFYLDGVSVTPNGGNIDCVWDAGGIATVG